MNGKPGGLAAERTIDEWMEDGGRQETIKGMAADCEAGYWEHFTHGADIGVRGFGSTLALAFEQAALAMTAVMTDPTRVMAKCPVPVTCEADDPELLLVNWLNGLVYETAVRHMLFSRFRVVIDGHHLQGTAWGEPISPQRHRPAVEVKGATLTELAVYHRENGCWVAQCVVDV